MGDGDLVSVYTAGSDIDRAGGVTPTILLLHGLEGSIRSNYMWGLAGRALDCGWSVAALEFRSCDGMPTHAPRLYHSGETSDLSRVVDWLLGPAAPFEAPITRLYLSGVSLGANVALKWLGENGADVPDQVKGAAMTSAPFDLEVSGPTLDRTLGGLYARRFLRTLVPKALAKQRQFPGLLDRRALLGCRTIEDFDTRATAPLHGFEDAWDYWRRVGCGQFLPGIDRPTLLISARDDPFNPAATLPCDIVEANPHLHACFTEHGGHVGFVEGWPLRTRHWAEEQAFAFLREVERRSHCAR